MIQFANMAEYNGRIHPLVDSIITVVDEPALTNMLEVAKKLEATPIPAARGRAEITLKALVDLFDNRNSPGAWPQIRSRVSGKTRTTGRGV